MRVSTPRTSERNASSRSSLTRDDDEEHRRLARDLAVDARRPRPSSGSRAELVHVGLELARVAAYPLRAEARLFDAAEQRHLPRDALVRQNGDPAELRQGLDHENAGQRRASRKVPGEERLLARQPPPAPGGLAGNDFVDLVDEEE